MRRTALTAVLASAVVLGPVLPATADPGTALPPTLPTDVTFASTDNVEYLGRFPEHVGTAGGKPSADGETFYVTDPRGVYTYDTSTPEDPVLLDSVPLYQTTSNTGLGTALAQEDPDTDGTVLLVDGATTPTGMARLQVVDVSDPKDLTVLSSLPVVEHTWTCVTGVDDAGVTRGCAYAYGRTGSIVDLTDPAMPVLLPQTWRESVDYGTRGNAPYTHDLTEVRPGLVVTAGASALVMDTTTPTAPVRLTELGDRTRFSSLGYHSVEWARGGRDRFVVLGTEIAPPAAPGLPAATANTAGSDCKGEESVIETWDASAFLLAMQAYEVDGDTGVFEGEMFREVDTYDASGRGIFLDGEAPASQLYCAHWMELSPEFEDGGVMAVGYYNRGTRFVRVGSDGTMEEIGWITGADGYTGSAQWISDRVVYVMDYRRGLEVVKLTQDKATKVVTKDEDSVAASSASFPSGGGGLGGEQLAWAALALLALGLVRAERVVRRREGALATA